MRPQSLHRKTAATACEQPSAPVACMGPLFSGNLTYAETSDLPRQYRHTESEQYPRGAVVHSSQMEQGEDIMGNY